MIKSGFLLFTSLSIGCTISSMRKDVADIFSSIKEKNTFPLFHHLQSRGNFIGFDVNTFDDEGCNILHHYAVYGNKPYVLKMLSERKIDFNAQNAEGETPFFIAIKHRNITGAFLLMRFGANPAIPNSEGRNALHLFLEDGEMVHFLNEVFTRSINKSKSKVINGFYSFVSCTSSTRVPMLKELAVKLIIKREDTIKAVLNSQISKDMKDYIILSACKNNCYFALKLLQNYRERQLYAWLRAELLNDQALMLPINTCDKAGNASLHYAVIHHLRLPLLHSLISCNASALLKNRNGKYPYELLEQKPCTFECRVFHEDLAELTAELKRPVQLIEYLNNEITYMALDQKE